jgi:hypothetical protein
MWLFTRYGFYSIACARQANGSVDPDALMIRARVAAHLRDLQRRFPALAGKEIVTLPDRDYRFRLIVPKGGNGDSNQLSNSVASYPTTSETGQFDRRFPPVAPVGESTLLRNMIAWDTRCGP